MSGVIGVIQARMGSKRLPGKVLMPIGDRPLLTTIVARIASAAVDEWWLAIPRGPQDRPLELCGRSLGLRVHGGDSDDVLSRFVEIVRDRAPGWVVRLTADNPFVDAGIVDLLVEAAQAESDADHVGGAAGSGLPLGYVPEIVRGDALLELGRTELPFHDRSHVTSALARAGRSRPLAIPASWPARPRWRWTVDTADDLAMADAAFRTFGGAWSTIDYPAMVDLLDGRPEITGRNASVRQKGVAEG